MIFAEVLCVLGSNIFGTLLGAIMTHACSMLRKRA